MLAEHSDPPAVPTKKVDDVRDVPDVPEQDDRDPEDSVNPASQYSNNIKQYIMNAVQKIQVRKTFSNTIGETVMAINYAFKMSLPSTPAKEDEVKTKFVVVGKTVFNVFFRKLFSKLAGKLQGNLGANKRMYAITQRKKLTQLVDPESLSEEFDTPDGVVVSKLLCTEKHPVYVDWVKNNTKVRFIYYATVLRVENGSYKRSLNVFG